MQEHGKENHESKYTGDLSHTIVHFRVVYKTCLNQHGSGALRDRFLFMFYLRPPLDLPLLLELLELRLLLLPMEPLLDEEELLLGVEKVELRVLLLLLEGVE